MIYVKIMGCLLIVASCAGMGIHFSRELKTRILDLREIKNIIYLLKGDIKYSHTPLPEAIQSLGFRHDGKFKNFLLTIADKLNELGGISLYNIWKDAAQTELLHTSLSKKDIENLIRVGESLGYLDKDVQINTLEQYIEHVEEEIHELSKGAKEKVYMYNALGVMAGIFIVIIMI